MPPQEVTDRPAELWIKLLVGVTVILVALIGYMGDMVIVGQYKQLKEMSEMNGSIKVYGSRISRVEYDVKEVRLISTANLARLNKMEGTR